MCLHEIFTNLMQSAILPKQRMGAQAREQMFYEGNGAHLNSHGHALSLIDDEVSHELPQEHVWY